MSISYEEALETLQVMFGNKWNRDHLDSVLRHEQGHMENTVDRILRHSDRDPQLLIDQLAAGIDPDESTRRMDEQLARQLAAGEQQRAASALSSSSLSSSSTSLPSSSSSSSPGSNLTHPTPSSGTSTNHAHGTPTNLPDDFLRIPGGFTPQSLVDDETLARMLQDELFSQELARNPQFAHLARGGRPVSHNTESFAAARRTFSARGGSGGRGGGGSQSAFGSPGPNLMDKIGEMGDQARRKLQLLAAQFNATTRAANLGQSRSSSQYDAATVTSPAATERRGLLDDMDDMELAARKEL